MKTELSALELFYLVKELQVLVGARLDTIYQPTSFFIQFHKSGAGKLYLTLTRSALWLSEKKTEMPPSVGGLCSQLRKHLEGKKVIAIEQINGERIVLFTLATQQDTYYLYVELFSSGNLILSDSHKKIITAIEERAWKDRAIKKGLTYQLPPPKNNILTLCEKDFLFENNTISKHLALLGFGKTYALELCHRSKIDPNSITLSDKERQHVISAYNDILHDTSGAHVYTDGEITPLALSHKEKGQPAPSFSFALDTHLSTTFTLQKLEKKRQKYRAEKDKIEDLLRLQNKNLIHAQQERTNHQRAGELIYEHYQELNDILSQLQKAKTKYSLQEIKAKLKGHPIIKDVNPKTGDFVVEVQDAF